MTRSVSLKSVKFELKKSFLVKLLPHLTCFRCLNVPNAESPNQDKFKCLDPEAHLLCDHCKEYCVEMKKGKCPCGSNVSTIACPLASSLVGMLPFCCRNRDNGCQEILSREEMKAHLSRCIFEDITCINLDCEDEMIFKDYLNHLPACANKTNVENKVEIILDDEIANWLPSQVQKNPLNKPLFYFSCEVDDEFVCAWIYFLGFKEDAERFTYSLEVNSTRSLKFAGPVKSIFESHDDIIHERDAFMLGLPIAKKISDESGALVFNIEIFDKKADVKDNDDSAMSDD